MEAGFSVLLCQSQDIPPEYMFELSQTYFKIYLLILFLAVLGLCGCMQSKVVESGGHCLVVVGLLIKVASFIVEHRL